eukprot:373746-Rhodomonas_salina.1
MCIRDSTQTAAVKISARKQLDTVNERLSGLPELLHLNTEVFFLSLPYAKPGTDTRAPYAKPGTGMRATPSPVCHTRALRYGHTRCPVQS